MKVRIPEYKWRYEDNPLYGELKLFPRKGSKNTEKKRKEDT